MRRSRLKLDALLHEYVAGDLDAARRAEVEARLADDPAARAALDEVRAAHDALQCLKERPSPVSGEDAFERIRVALVSDRFRQRPLLHLEGEGTRYYRRVALAATALLAVTVGLFAVQRLAGDEAATPAARPAERNLERVPERELLELGYNRDGVSALEWIRKLEENGVAPGEAVVEPTYNVTPIVYGAVEDR